MGKHYTTEFKLQILRPILNREMSIREAARFYNIPSNVLVGTWLKRFEKSGIKGLIPRKPSGRPPMKPNICKNATATQNRRRAFAPVYQR